jgi:hypothetical protein
VQVEFENKNEELSVKPEIFSEKSFVLQESDAGNPLP